MTHVSVSNLLSALCSSPTSSSLLPPAHPYSLRPPLYVTVIRASLQQPLLKATPSEAFPATDLKSESFELVHHNLVVLDRGASKMPSDHDVSPISSPALSRINSRNSAVSSLDISPISSPVFSPTQLSSSGHGAATSDTATTNSFERSFTDADDWFGRFREDLDISDECPDRGQLAVAGQVPVYDANGNSRLFSTFFTGLDAIGDRQFIIFVRHFYCGVSIMSIGRPKTHTNFRSCRLARLT